MFARHKFDYYFSPYLLDPPLKPSDLFFKYSLLQTRQWFIKRWSLNRMTLIVMNTHVGHAQGQELTLVALFLFKNGGMIRSSETSHISAFIVYSQIVIC